MYNRLFILVEGNDDERFFERIIKPEFQKIYDHVQLYKYASQSSKKIENFVNVINSMNADYIVAADINHSPCVTQKKGTLISKKIRNVEKDKLIVVIKEIESWYMAGLEEKSKEKIGIKHGESSTNDLSKEYFNRLMPKKYISRIEFMQEILKYFKKKTAVKNNKSFAYFLEKYGLA
ncbi:hypothetical protein ACFLRB_00940 [Acidobacteriota bacterium]